MSAITARGDHLMMQSRWRDAAAQYERAIPVLEKSQGSRDTLASAWSSLCRAYVELHQPARALAPLERLASKLRELPPGIRVAVEFTLARALWDSGGDRRRAHDLASRALAWIQGTTGTNRNDAADVGRWLASHRIP